MIIRQIQTIIKQYFIDNISTINREMLLFDQICNTYIAELFFVDFNHNSK